MTKQPFGRLLAISAISALALATSHASPLPVKNASFESNVAPNGSDSTVVPAGWTAFNEAGATDIGSGHPNSGQYTANNPLGAPALGNQYCWINMFDSSTTGGIYQDVGPLQPDGVYTLTVAIGSRKDRVNSPGIISLVNGTDDTGTVLATGGGLPASPNTWQDYSISFTNTPAASGDLTIVLSVLGGTTIQADFDNVRLDGPLPPVPLPFLIQDTLPASASVAVGSNAVFTAAFSNTPPVSLQWQEILVGPPNVTNNINTGVVNVTNNGVVTSTLTIAHAQPAASGSYAVEALNATNNAGVTYSTPAPLAVIPLITWYAPGTYNSSFSDDTVLALAGAVANEVYGVDFGGSGPQTTANGYSFDDYLNTGNFSIAGNPTPTGQYLANGATTGDGALDTILTYGVFGSTASTGTLNNLTVGQAYTVMVLLDDTEGSVANGQNFVVTDGITTSPEQQYAFANGTPAVGGYIIGTFTAQATNQPLTVENINGSTYNSQYNAILLLTGIAPPPLIPPTFTTNINPLLSEAALGGPVTLSVGAAGSTPLYYQWYNQNGAISGANNSSYVFNALDGTNEYYVAVSNSVSAIQSPNAVVIGAADIVTVNNFSFEQNAGGAAGKVVAAVPSGWTAFNQAATGDIGSQWAGGVDFSTFSPLAPPADENQYCYINMFNPNVTGGIYQDVGPMKTNTIYTLTVAIGSRADRINSAGIISLIKGSDNTGQVIVSGGGLPPNQDSWQDYTVSFTNGTSTADLTIALSVIGNATTIQADFDNVTLTTAPATVPPPAFTVINPSFEVEAVPAGQASPNVPTGWSEFNQAAPGDIGSQDAGGTDFAVFDPLEPPADGNQFCYINMFSPTVTGGIYQDAGSFEPNTTYALTVAIGSRADRVNSPGIISLVNGSNNNGTVLATGGGIPATQNTWLDYSVTYTSGALVSGDLTIVLSVLGNATTVQADFDNVLLTTKPGVLAPKIGKLKVSSGNVILTGSGGTANTGYTLLSTTNLAGPIVWTTNSTGMTDASGTFSNSVPIGSARARFYQVRVP